nr:DotA/TraY family protein [Alphaproteobacteria bacterium]
PLLPFFRFMLGVLGWVLLLFEAILAMPLLAISLLKTDGEGFMTQNFQTGAVMILALIIRPMLMIFGLLLGLMAFNGIMNITNVSYLAAIGGTDSNLDNSLLSMVVYLIIYGILAYTLANSAFKAIDILPNQVMSWLGARLDQRVDDASTIHQQTSGMVNQLGMVSAMGGMGAGGPRNQQGSGDFIGPRQSPGTSGGSGVEPPRPG